MEYEYIIHKPGTMDEIAARFVVPTPQAHIQAGSSLLLESDQFSTTAGFHLEVRHVESYVRAPTEGAPPTRTIVHVFTRERDRAAVIGLLKG